MDMGLIRGFACTLVFALFFCTPALAQTGKITGVVTDASTGEPLPGVNVVIVGAQQGATTNTEGLYNILNVSPGNYDVRASFVGYAPVTQEGVRVNINLTTEVNFEMQEQTVGLEEVTVQATEPVVKRDISANVANLNAEEIANVPVASLSEVIGLQAGVEGLSVRGSNLNELQFNVDGFSMRDGRDNTPFTGVSYTSVQSVQVQTGGFNAEYGNVRSGLINVVTKEGPRDHYTADVMLRYSPAQQRYFGPRPNAGINGEVAPEEMTYWVRPYMDPEVAFVGTRSEESPWDRYTQRQYPDFDGWNTISEQLMSDDDPSNDLTPEQLVEVFQFRGRKSFEIDDPDYEIDGSIGGPVPGVSSYLGDLRFMASYRQTQSAYAVPMRRETYMDRMGQFKLTSDVSNSMKLTLLGMYAKQKGLNPSAVGFATMLQGDGDTFSYLNRDNMWTLDRWSLSDVTRNMVGATLTHTLSSNTFYEVELQRNHSDYLTGPGPFRDRETIVETIGSMELDEQPFGVALDLETGFAGERISGYMARARDSSEIAVYNGSFDLTSQVNNNLMLKGGANYIFTHHNADHRQAAVHQSFDNPIYQWERYPRQGALYAQSKFEFEGLIANLGLRLDYFHAGGEWYQYDRFTRGFSPAHGNEVGEFLDQEPVGRQVYLSPRLGVSFPITTNSKLFFNYGHFRSMLDPIDLYVTRRITTGAIDQIGNPEHPMPRTVAYELGYEQNLFDRFLLRLTGYYKALGEQPRLVNYQSLDGEVQYAKSLPYNYEDIRGFEASLQKNTGWVRGFLNYTYMSTKQGNFGFSWYYENLFEQRQFERTSRAHYQSKPVPQPFARANVAFLSPSEFGPEWAGVHPLGKWRLSLLGTWEAGSYFTWTGSGGAIPGLENNVQWTAYKNLDLRLAKSFDTGLGETQFFVDVSNVLNFKRCCGSGFEGSFDYENYLTSLHLPEDAFEGGDIEGVPYQYVPGDDQPGDYREEGAEFVPIEAFSSRDQLPAEGYIRSEGFYGPLYYAKAEESYYIWDGSSYVEADEGKVDQVLEDKAYIDMPNERYFTFLSPRRLRLGIRVSL